MNTSAYHATQTPPPPVVQQQQQQQPQLIKPPSKSNNHNLAPAPIQRNAINGSIEPIYENVPLPQFNVATQRNTEQRSSGSSSHANEAMRNRTSSIQSAPGGIQPQPPVPAARHHHNQKQQQLQQQQQQQPTQIVAPHYEPDEISMNIKKFGSQLHAERAASTDLQLLEPQPTQRVMRAASAAPALGMPQTAARHARVAAAVSLGGSTLLRGQENNAATMRHYSEAPTNLQEQFSAMNLSGSSANTANGERSFFNSTIDTHSNTTNTTYSSNTSSSKDTGKRKKRWNILGRSKTPDKQKSATLGREKSVPNLSSSKVLLAQDDLNIRSRWSTGVPRLQPISGQFSKDKLCQILNDKLNDTQLFMEFEGIPKRRQHAAYDCALMEENAIKNFDPNFLPYDDNRVRLTPTMENRHGYVNASHVSATVGTKQRFYIVAQSPHEDFTARIFWQCVWEADVYLIVQLSDDLNYIPANSNHRMEFGQVSIKSIIWQSYRV